MKQTITLAVCEALLNVPQQTVMMRKACTQALQTMKEKGVTELQCERKDYLNVMLYSGESFNAN